MSVRTQPASWTPLSVGPWPALFFLLAFPVMLIVQTHSLPRLGVAVVWALAVLWTWAYPVWLRPVPSAAEFDTERQVVVLHLYGLRLEHPYSTVQEPVVVWRDMAWGWKDQANLIELTVRRRGWPWARKYSIYCSDVAGFTKESIGLDVLLA